MKTSKRSVPVVLAVALLAIGVTTTAAQEKIRRLPPTKIMIDEDALAAFVDEPCRHFEAARDQFLADNRSQAAKHLRTASAFLRLESARAGGQSRAVLDASVRELQDIATATESGKVKSVETLKQVFARAHFALAGHHCVKSAHRCCQPDPSSDKNELKRAGHDLRAVASHLERGSQWAGKELDKETQRTIKQSRVAAKTLIEHGVSTPTKLQHSIHSLHKKLERLTNHKIMLARPITADDDEGAPSIFR